LETPIHCPKKRISDLGLVICGGGIISLRRSRYHLKGRKEESGEDESQLEASSREADMPY
jgi:hypothetical protein